MDRRKGTRLSEKTFDSTRRKDVTVRRKDITAQRYYGSTGRYYDLKGRYYVSTKRITNIVPLLATYMCVQLVNARSLADCWKLVSEDQARLPFSQPCLQGICCLYAKGYMASLLFTYNGVYFLVLNGVYFSPIPYGGDFRLECSY